LFKSTDGGGHWSELSQRAFYFHRVYTDPVARDTALLSPVTGN